MRLLQLRGRRRVVCLACLLCSPGALVFAGHAFADALPASPAAAGHTGAALAGAWSDLWHTRDQQGERLLEQGDAARAAQRFGDPRRRAYADLQAGRYAEAAKLLAPLKDTESRYNLGNALAHAGQLQPALTAYDAALALDPGNHDARHNRDLVARALAQQQKDSSQPQDNGSQGTGARQSGGGSHPNAASAAHAGGQHSDDSRGNADAQGGAQAQGSANAPRGTNAHGTANAHDTANAHGSANAQNGSDARGDAGARSARAQGDAGTEGLYGQNNPAGAARQPATVLSPPALAASRAPPPARPESEQALSLQQWLRRIPDDPGGLLRRKFLIEHLMRQQADPSQDGPQP